MFIHVGCSSSICGDHSWMGGVVVDAARELARAKEEACDYYWEGNLISV